MKPNWFVAAPIDGSFLDTFLDDLPESCRAFHPDDLHMTVAFLGAMDPNRVDDLMPIFESVTAAPFTITFGGMVALPSPKKVSALCLDVDTGHSPASQLIGDYRNAFAQAVGARQELRPPLPHITVARPMRRSGVEGRRAALEWVEGKRPPSGTYRIDQLALYTWSQDRRVRLFRQVFSMPLTAKSV